MNATTTITYRGIALDVEHSEDGIDGIYLCEGCGWRHEIMGLFDDAQLYDIRERAEKRCADMSAQMKVGERADDRRASEESRHRQMWPVPRQTYTLPPIPTPQPITTMPVKMREEEK